MYFFNRKSAGLLATALAWACPLVSQEPREPVYNGQIITLDTFIVEGAEVSPSEQLIDSRAIKLYKITDLAEMVSDEFIEASMVRKSAYGNEVNLRGFSQANLPVMINGGFLEGACGGRKDPGLSHINLLTVERLVVREGPFDVTLPGGLGGYIDVLTKEPEEGSSGRVMARVGSFDFFNAGFRANESMESTGVLLGYSYSQSGQYEDGSGVALWKLRDGYAASYNDAGKKANAFRKNDIWGAVKVSTGTDSELMAEYAYGNARDILTPRVEFDTGEEETSLARLTWRAYHLGRFSDEFRIRAYCNDVGHYPTQAFRNVAVPKKVVAKSLIAGMDVFNSVLVDNTQLVFGANYYYRDWRADVYNEQTSALLNGFLVPSVELYNAGIYLQSEGTYGTVVLRSGVRLDHASSESDEALPRSLAMTSTNRNDDTLISGFVSARLPLSESAQIFAGVGRSYRLPTGVERYIQSNATYFGNPDLEPVANTEMDLGMKWSGRRWNLQIKGFYSLLDDYIYQVVTEEGWSTYQNIDASIYGADLKGSLELSQAFSLDYGIAYQRGRKENTLEMNVDKDLGQMSPYKSSLTLNYIHNFSLQKDSSFFSSLEWVHGGRSSKVDELAGEKTLPAWDAVNVRSGLHLHSWTIILGVENLFDETYAVANSYEWDVVGGVASNPLIINEPGRFLYSSVSYEW